MRRDTATQKKTANSIRSQFRQRVWKGRDQVDFSDNNRKRAQTKNGKLIIMRVHDVSFSHFQIKQQKLYF